MSSTSTTMIAPVTRNFPATIECYENSNIPLSMTVSPLNNVPILSLSSSSSTSTSSTEKGIATNQDQQQEQQEALLLLTNIPKCYHCGAPHSSTFTYDRFPILVEDDVVDEYYQQQQQQQYQYQPYPIDRNTKHTPRNSNTYMYYCRLCCKTFTTTIYNNNDNTTEQQDQQEQDYEKTALQRHMTPKVRNTSHNNLTSTTASTTTGNNNNNNNNNNNYDNNFNNTNTKSKIKQHKMEETQLFALPLRIPNTTSSSLSSSTTTILPIYKMPAMQCPILWYICLDGGTIATSMNTDYWKSIANSIQSCIEMAPSHVHIALMIASQRDVIVSDPKHKMNNTTNTSTTPTIHDTTIIIEQQKLLSIYDLYSPIPKINCISSDELVCTEEQIIQEILYNSAVPCITPYIHHIYTALRSLIDYPNTILQQHQNQQSSTNTTTSSSNSNTSKNYKYRCPIGWVTEVITTSFQYGAIHVGHRNTNNNINNNNLNENYYSNHNHKLVYTGMKLTFLLCDRPTGICHKNHYVSHKSSYHNNQPPIGERYTYHKQNHEQQQNRDTNKKNLNNNNNKSDPMDQMEHQNIINNQYQNNNNNHEIELTPQQLYYRYNMNHIDANQLIEYYNDLGRECSDMAIGIDILLFMNNTNTNIPDFGLSLYQLLSERSGAPPPLLFDLSTINDDNNITDNNSSTSNSNTKRMRTRLEYELLSRTPWQTGRVYGAELRVRISPGYVVDPNTVTRIHNIIGPQLAPLYNESGCIGPISSVNESSQLWRMGTTDQYTSYTFDLTMIPNTITRDHITLNGLDYEINIHPVIQICFAYTTIVSESDETTGDVSHYTVRQMRIANRIVPFAYTVEALLASIDTEALAVVLFHRIALASYQDGIIEASNMTQQWLQCFLVCVYKSAMEQFAIEEQNRQNGIIESNYDTYDKSYRYYYPGERLLFLEGELSAEDVLLAQGHERLRPIVLMVYLLLQSDPFRCSSDYYHPSYDDRCAKLANMSSMTPSSLTRCIAPRIQLWESGIDVMEPIYDVLDLRSDAIQAAILECTSTVSNSNGRSTPGLILFLDTPEQIVVMDARYVNNTNLGSSSTSIGLRHHSPTKQHNKDDDRLVIGIGLQNAIIDAANSYRVRPPILYELHQSDTNGERTLLRLVDHLIEDTYHVASDSENFNDWRIQIAQDVQIDVDNLQLK